MVRGVGVLWGENVVWNLRRDIGEIFCEEVLGGVARGRKSCVSVYSVRYAGVCVRSVYVLYCCENVGNVNEKKYVSERVRV